jgi:tRNA U34 5-methylaminomethyl-2-thiouridine-forming methyltransferase MnmC
VTDLVLRTGADGSFSLWSEAFQEGFHSGRGALREARETFLAPSQLERFPPDASLRVVEVCAGTGGNLAVLLEACAARKLRLEWWGLELDPSPLALALATEAFRRAWPSETLAALDALSDRGRWQSQGSTGRMLWGDARQTLAELALARRGQVDLVWHDAFSPRRCPQLWTMECLQSATALLTRDGRWISYSAAAAVRETLRLLGLRVVALEGAAMAAPQGLDAGSNPSGGAAGPPGGAARRSAWSGGTVASPSPLEGGAAEGGAAEAGAAGVAGAAGHLWRELSTMEREHLASAAGEPYRDPSGTADAAAILASRSQAQRAALARGERLPSSAWRRRWGLERVG